MIKTGARLTVRRLPLSYLQILETNSCFPEKFATYLQLLQDNPEQDVDPLIVAPSKMHPGMFTIQNGKHRYTASIMAGRKDILCVVVEEVGSANN